MADYTLAEDFELPSLGKLYGDISPNIKLRSMTTQDEMKRLSNSERPYKTLCDIIDDCIVDKYPISSYDMILGDYQFLLHKLRIVTYGSEYNSISMCPFCGNANNGIIDLDELEVMKYTDEFKSYSEFTTPSGYHITLNYQTPRMIDNVSIRVKEQRNKTPEIKFDPSLMFTMCELIKTVNHNVMHPVELEQFVRNLRMVDTNYIMKKAAKMNDVIGINTELEGECQFCGLTYKSSFRQTGEFFGPSID